MYFVESHVSVPLVLHYGLLESYTTFPWRKSVQRDDDEGRAGVYGCVDEKTHGGSAVREGQMRLEHLIPQREVEPSAMALGHEMDQRHGNILGI